MKSPVERHGKGFTLTTEYTSKVFEAFLKSEGVHHVCTISKLDAKLPHEFWVETVSTAIYLRNHCQTKAVEGMTPYEAWHSEKPKVEHLRVFGCAAYAHIPKDERSKFDSKARKCILLDMAKKQRGTGCLTQFEGVT